MFAFGIVTSLWESSYSCPHPKVWAAKSVRVVPRPSCPMGILSTFLLLSNNSETKTCLIQDFTFFALHHLDHVGRWSICYSEGFLKIILKY